MNLRVKMLTDEQLQKFHESSLQILAETGIKFHRPEAVEILKRHGATSDGDVVRLPQSLIEKCLESSPREFTWSGLNNETAVQVRHEPLVSPAVGPVFVHDIKNGRRMAGCDDYDNIIKILQHLDIVSINGGMPVDIGELPSEKRYLYMLSSMLRHTNKPILGFCLEKNLVRSTLKFYEAVTEDEKIWEKGHYLAAVCTTLSPLAMDQDTIDTIFEYASRNQIVIAASCIMAGISGPIHPLGTAVLQNAEILAGIVLAQCVRPGCPVLYSVASSAGYMKDASFGGGSPDAMMIHGPCIQAAIDLYDLPIRTMTGINSAKEADYQAGLETGMSALMAGLIGGGVWPQSLGVLDDIMTLSYEKILLDTEALSRAIHIRKGLEVSEETLSVKAIQDIGHQGNYLMHQDTFSHYSKLWTPTFLHWDSMDKWQSDGSVDLLGQVNDKMKSILHDAPASLLAPDQQKTMDKAVKKFF